MPPEHTDADEAALAALRADEYLGPVVERHGPLTVDPAADLFERLLVSILRQQVSMASAAATRERLFEAVDVTPEGVLAADTETLKAAGLSRQKTRYVRAVATAFDDHGWTRTDFDAMSGPAVRDALADVTGVGPWTADMHLLSNRVDGRRIEGGELARLVLERHSDEGIADLLTDITGIGPWTARMQLLFTFGRPDVFPVGDLGVRKGVETLFDREMTRAEMVAESERWAPYRSYASLYLWRVNEDVGAGVDEVMTADSE